ncbi:MAG TPA: hypothetical protein HPP80_09095, partial [Rhodospirillaceae bacterium]|nr:hypothetical protein [Rhodospirillaceae bacterium]
MGNGFEFSDQVGPESSGSEGLPKPVPPAAPSFALAEDAQPLMPAAAEPAAPPPPSPSLDFADHLPNIENATPTL